MKTTSIHIGRKSAALDVCPECGLSMYKPKDGSISEVLKSVYNSPSHVEKREVPGWKGFHTWWWICHHEDPMKIFVYNENPFLKMIPKNSDFGGRVFQLPLRYTPK